MRSSAGASGMTGSRIELRPAAPRAAADRLRPEPASSLQNVAGERADAARMRSDARALAVAACCAAALRRRRARARPRARRLPAGHRRRRRPWLAAHVRRRPCVPGQRRARDARRCRPCAPSRRLRRRRAAPRGRHGRPSLLRARRLGRPLADLARRAPATCRARGATALGETIGWGEAAAVERRRDRRRGCTAPATGRHPRPPLHRGRRRHRLRRPHGGRRSGRDATSSTSAAARSTRDAAPPSRRRTRDARIRSCAAHGASCTAQRRTCGRVTRRERRRAMVRQRTSQDPLRARSSLALGATIGAASAATQRRQACADARRRSDGLLGAGGALGRPLPRQRRARAARARAAARRRRRCAAPPTGHAVDMVRRRYFAHVSPEGAPVRPAGHAPGYVQRRPPLGRRRGHRLGHRRGRLARGHRRRRG